MQYTSDDDATRFGRLRLELESFDQFGIELLRLDANPAARDLSIFHNTFQNLLGGRYGNGKSNAHGAARARVDRGVDAQQVAVHIDQRAAGIAGIDRCIGLDKILEGVDTQLVASQRAHDAAGHSLTDAKRVANGQHGVAHHQRIGVAEHNDGQLVQFDLEDGQVGVGVGANYLGLGLAGVVKDDLDFIRAFDDVVVGQYVAAAAYDNAAA